MIFRLRWSKGSRTDGRRLPPQVGDLHWFEFVREPGVAPPLPTTRMVERAGAAAWPSRYRRW